MARGTRRINGADVAMRQDEKGGAPPRGSGTRLEPGMWVRHPGQPGWGIGQVQSVAGDRVTVNFEDAGKVVVNTANVSLEPTDT